MKRNEKLLVYGVTGFLAVIVLVAILFGNDPAVDGRERAELVGDGAADPAVQETTQGERRSLADLLGGADGAGPGESGEESQGGPEGAGEGGPEKGDEGRTRDPYALNASPLGTTAQQLRRLLGPSRVERGYRIVEARRGDSFSQLVQRWCPGMDGASSQVRILNENLVGENPLVRAGQTIVMPLVEDEEVLAAWQNRLADGDTIPATMDGGTVTADPATTSPTGSPTNASAPAPTPTAPTGALTYKVKPGDSAWKIAASRVGNNKAPAFIDEMKRLNPQVEDIGALKVGQELKLPR